MLEQTTEQASGRIISLNEKFGGRSHIDIASGLHTSLYLDVKLSISLPRNFLDSFAVFALQGNQKPKRMVWATQYGATRFRRVVHVARL